MKVLCGEGVANRTDPESCAASREGRSEALAGDSAGQPLSGENQLRGADLSVVQKTIRPVSRSRDIGRPRVVVDTGMR